MAKYVYYTATESIEIEVENSWAAQLVAEDIREQNSERKQKRPDHKYAPGTPISIDSFQFEGLWIADRCDAFRAVDFSLDLTKALLHLTALQRRYYILTRVDGYSFAEIARQDGKLRGTVYSTVKAAEEKLRKHFW